MHSRVPVLIRGEGFVKDAYFPLLLFKAFFAAILLVVLQRFC